MTAPSRESAMKQWAELLGGELDARGADLLAFSWRESPIRLVVEIEPSQPPGPKHVEVSFEAERALPPGPNPGLGARFVAV
jgi:hypothetical protein